MKTLLIFFISILYSPFFFRLKSFFINLGKKKDKKIVWVGVSGGVDSSVAVVLLKKQGYEVVGVFMKVYQPEVSTFCWRDEMLDSKKVCKHLKIPFVFLNLEKEYKENIFNYMIDLYKKGFTPNPDVFCNKFIKFGSFLEYALKHGAYKIAMGHYARIYFDQNLQKFKLKKGIDQNKDQSYFLSSISQKQLSKSLFPLGDIKKEEVRKIAEENNLFTARKKDSQGLCFVGKVNMREFLQNYLPKKKGDVLNIRGENIGVHEGNIFYTIGERHGFEIFPKFKTTNSPRYFILKKDIEKNTITVGEKNNENLKNYLEKKDIEITNLNLILEKIDFSKKYTGMIRYRGKLIDLKLEKLSENNILIKFSSPQNSVAKGQILVIYDDNVCLGEGEIVG